MVSQQVVVYSMLNHLCQSSERKFLQIQWSANLYKLSTSVPSTRNSLDTLILNIRVTVIIFIIFGSLFILLSQSILNGGAPYLILIYFIRIIMILKMMKKKLFQLKVELWVDKKIGFQLIDSFPDGLKSNKDSLSDLPDQRVFFNFFHDELIGRDKMMGPF